jgi:hypothetical protein
VQQFRARPRIVTALQMRDAPVNDEGIPALPGRWPASGWNGELDAQSPVTDRGGV